MFKWIITCEHATNHVPPLLEESLGKHRSVLSSHRAYDRGALEVATELAAITDAPLIAAPFTRLAVDTNRSPFNPSRFSSYSRALGHEAMFTLERTCYYPFRTTVEHVIAAEIDRGAVVLHISMHSFTPVLRGISRNADIGLLYDPTRIGEVTFARSLKAALSATITPARIRYNYPYTGVSDGMAAWLRKKHGAEQYIGLEFEINQRLTRLTSQWEQYKKLFRESIGSIYHNGSSSF